MHHTVRDCGDPGGVDLGQQPVGHFGQFGLLRFVGGLGRIKP